MSSSKFNHVFLISRARPDGIGETLRNVSTYLSQLNIAITVETETATRFDCTHLPNCNADNLPASIDLILVVGGDGSLITAAHTACEHNIPVVGINRGKLGFLTDIHPEKLDQLGVILKGKYIQEKRTLIQAQIFLNDELQHSAVALNDIVLLPGDIAHMIEFDTYVDSQLIYHQRADGMIIATSTGSTAYALSGGGPIMQPGIDTIVLVPMFPHTLSSRPIVLSNNSKIKLIINHKNETSPFMSNDGKQRIKAPLGSEIHITKHHQRLNLIHPSDYNYFSTLREKLGWEQQATRR